MAYRGIHRIPLFLFILFPFTFLGTYLAAVWQGHVEEVFPYISDAATYSPESCVFGQLINFGAVLLSIVIYARYCEVCQFYELYDISPRVIKLNKLALWLGFISAFGLSIVANFQETNVKYVHLSGALLCFGAGSAYFFIQGICSYHLHTIANSLLVAHLRVLLATVATIFFFVAAICGIMSHLQYDGKDPTKWHRDDGGWVLHVISTASEWVVATCFCFSILTFHSEFSVMSFTHPQIYLDTDHILIDQREREPMAS
ncbi:Frag1/DRAM/Sfk1 family [Nesidiocoris tenuis]|uniref:Frag1/DRAM/Sfk1 family n=1 Tax=Nesidiocoris tenuis TaxID=355587 RepID=A0ABN7B5C7_9HEMI|nr:Frag1/DRAM/Sfk1 family [Nesidiocoris tenuis]